MRGGGALAGVDVWVGEDAQLQNKGVVPILNREMPWRKTNRKFLKANGKRRKANVKFGRAEIKFGKAEIKFGRAEMKFGKADGKFVRADGKFVRWDAALKPLKGALIRFAPFYMDYY